MAALTVWKFPTPDGAEQAEDTLLDLRKQGLIQIHDAAIVTYPEGKKKPKLRQLHNMIDEGVLGGAFWGFLIGLIFLAPILGFALGAGAGAIDGMFTDVGIDDEFIKKVRDEVEPGTSALFVLSSDAVLDKVRQAFAGQPIELIRSNLDSDEEARLHDLFSDR